MNLELESDMKAAELKGLHPQMVDTTWTENGVIKYGKAIFTEDGEFTLSNPASREYIVTVLGEKYGVCIFHTHPDFLAQGWVAENAINGWESDIYESRTECIRHAVMGVKDE